jgi:hypothetical protein
MVAIVVGRSVFLRLHATIVGAAFCRANLHPPRSRNEPTIAGYAALLDDREASRLCDRSSISEVFEGALTRAEFSAISPSRTKHAQALLAFKLFFHHVFRRGDCSLAPLAAVLLPVSWAIDPCLASLAFPEIIVGGNWASE